MQEQEQEQEPDQMATAAVMCGGGYLTIWWKSQVVKRSIARASE